MGGILLLLMETINEIWLIFKQLPILGDYAEYWVFGVLAAFLLYLTIQIIRKFRNPQDIGAIEVHPDDVMAAQLYHEPISREKIAKFFIRIFKLQIGAKQDAHFRVTPVDGGPSNTSQTYKLEVAHNDQWQKRRMTVARTGEESASRSQCYHVIYDRHLVVKVPHKPISDFDAYIRNILADHQIVKKLAPRECIVPTVSAIINMIRPSTDGRRTAPVEQEEQNINWLIKYPGFQEYLKIDDYFVYVMDLSKFYFLGDILNDLHDLERREYNEIVGYPAVIWESYGFEGRYGHGNDTVLDNVKNIYTIYEKHLQEFLKTKGYKKVVDRYKVQKWFLIHLAGRQIDASEKELTPHLIQDLNTKIQELMSAHKTAVDNYRRTIKRCVQKVTVGQNKLQMAGLVVNLLDLLHWLRTQKVALRDLKPDNLLIAGDRNKYPDFLDSHRDYSIGLIDVETAIDYSADDVNDIPQPLLGGTPSYATPANLCVNTALAEYFIDLRRLLYLQDWYAAIGMIFKVVTGEILFDQTAKLLIGLKGQLLGAIGDPDEHFGIFKMVSRMFWQCAMTELKSKMAENDKLLKSVKVNITEETRQMVKAEIQKGIDTLNQRAQQFIQNQSVFTGEKNCRGLICATREHVRQLKTKLQKKQPHGQKQAAHHAEAISVLQTLEKYKVLTEKHQQLLGNFEPTELNLTAYHLMDLIFNIVYHAMYRGEWGDLMASPTAIAAATRTSGEITLEETV